MTQVADGQSLGVSGPLWKMQLLLAGSWDLVSRLIMGMIGVIIWLIEVIYMLTKSP